MDTIRSTFMAIREQRNVPAGDKLKQMTDELLLDHPSLTFKQAFTRVCFTERELHEEYLFSNGTR